MKIVNCEIPEQEHFDGAADSVRLVIIYRAIRRIEEALSRTPEPSQPYSPEEAARDIERAKQPSQVSAEQQDLEAISARVHDAWMETKRQMGFHGPSEHCDLTYRRLISEGMFNAEQVDSLGWKAKKPPCDHCHADLIPYEQLSDEKKELDRATVRTVLKAIAEATPAVVEGQPDPEKWLSDNWQLSIMNATKPLFRRVPITGPNSYHTIGTVLLEFAEAYASSSRAAKPEGE